MGGGEATVFGLVVWALIGFSCVMAPRIKGVCIEITYVSELVTFCFMGPLIWIIYLSCGYNAYWESKNEALD